MNPRRYLLSICVALPLGTLLHGCGVTEWQVKQDQLNEQQARVSKMLDGMGVPKNLRDTTIDLYSDDIQRRIEEAKPVREPTIERRT